VPLPLFVLGTANERITVHNMVLAVKGLGKLSWMVILIPLSRLMLLYIIALHYEFGVH